MAYLGNNLQVAFPSYRNIDDISGSFDGIETSFALTVDGVAPVPAPINSQQCLISVNGVVQRPDDSGTEGFRLSGGNIIFASAPAGGVDFFGVILAGADYVNVGADFPSGTASAPSITFDSDLDTGIYNPAGNEIGFTTGGTQRLVINSSGQISSGLGNAAAPAFSFISDPNTGIYSPGADQVAISTNGTGRLFVDASGRVGVGTGSASTVFEVIGTSTIPTYKPTIQIDATDNVNPFVALHRYIGVANQWRSVRQRVLDSGGTFAIETSDAAAIGSHTWSNRLVLSNAGTLEVSAAATTAPFISYIGGTEAARIDSSGRLLVGTSSARSNLFNSSVTAVAQVEVTAASVVEYLGVRNTDNNNGSDIVLAKSRGTAAGSNTIVQSDDGLGTVAFMGSDGTEFVLGGRIACEVDGTPGANDMPGRLVFSTTADGASSPTERMRIGSDGWVYIGTTSKTLYSATSGSGWSWNGSELGIATNQSNGLYINRTISDGDLIKFIQAGSTEGTISVSGTTVSYNGGHLSRWSQIPSIDPYDKTVRPEILRGTIMSNLDEMCDWTCPESGECQDNEQLNKTKISNVEGDKNVAGVFQSWDDDDDTWVNDFYLAMTGDFVIRIAAGTTVERGDLLMSAGDGTAKPQDDDIIRSKTIAKVTSTNVSCTYDDGSYCVPCVLMAC